jgi:RimK family alpha-L-glutamate ligase
MEGEEKKEEIEYHLENELHELLSILKKKKIYAPNLSYFLKHPYYNKFTQAHIFSSEKIPSIPTIHLNDNKIDKVMVFLDKVGWNFPLVAKESYGARGSKVWKVGNERELADFLEKRRNMNVIFQPYLENNCDFRAIVVNGKCLGIMKREAVGEEWKNNFSLGGKVGKHEDNPMEKFAENVCQKMRLDIAGLDIFSTKDGFLVIECNLFFVLDGFESVYENSNVSEKIIELILKNLK